VVHILKVAPRPNLPPFNIKNAGNAEIDTYIGVPGGFPITFGATK
jgi:hypothetical protein